MSFILFLCVSQKANAQITIAGSTGTANGVYTSLTNAGGAFAALNTAGSHNPADVITISITADVLAELGTNSLNAGTWASITVTPVGARTISGAAVAGTPLIDFNGADNVTVNGLNSGGNSLIIENTTVSATSGTSTIRFIGGATTNTITNCSLKGAVSSSIATNGAVVFFSTDAATASGNDNNTISNCDIGPSGANLPTKCILGNGSTTTTAIGNSGNVITNNDIHDYFGAAVTSAGIATIGGCNTWTITNNRFYQTATRTWTTGALHNAINIANTTATSGAQGFTITGNIVGYASNTQTGTYTLTGSTGSFRGIVFNGITGGIVSNINSNTVAAVSLTGVTGSGTTSSAPFMGIYVTNGVAITNSNTIGSQSATGSLVYSTTSASAADMMGMFNFSVDAWTANNNLIGGITSSNAGAGAANTYGMRLNTSSTVITTLSGNTIGGTVANSIQSTSAAIGAQVAGIFISTSIATVSNNTIRNLTNAGGTGTTTAASVVGIDFISATPVNTASQNTIFNLTNTNAAAATIVTGIQFTGATGNVVERNLIHSLTTSTTSAAAEVNGIRVAGGTTIYRNNMIALGAGVTNAIGSAATNSATTGVNGINEFLGTNSFFHNSVYIGGSPTAGSGASYTFNGTQTVNTRSFRDNIFFNARSNSGATGTNYAVKINGIFPNPTGLTINNNIYFANGTGAVFGFFNSLDVANLAAWKTAVGQDAGSFENNPQYNDPTNATPDLHIHPTNPTVAEGNGVDVGVTNDYDGQTRSGLTPVDIGADAGNFTGIDLSAPVISGITLTGTVCNVTSRTVTVTMTDATGVDNTASFRPRIFFQKNGAGYVSAQGTLSSGTVINGSWTFTISYAAVGGVVPTDVITYFIVAQDTYTPFNVGGNPSGGLVLTDVNTITTPPTTPFTYTIGTVLPGGTYTVGGAGTYLTLTAAVAAYNSSCLIGPIVFQLLDATYSGAETFPIVINANFDASSTNTLTIRPAASVVTSITGSATGALIKLNGAKYVTIDGSNSGGSDRSLTIENTSVTTPSVVLIGSIGTTPVTNNTLKNCIIRNGINTNSAVIISDAGTPGNAGFFDNITVQDNDVQKAFVGVFANGGTIPQNGSNLTYTQNTVNTSGANAIRNVGLYMQGVNGATVSNNTIGNFSNTDGENDIGIWLATGTINATVSNNTVATVGYTGTSAFAPIGINITSGTAATNNNITGNSVSDISTNGSSQVRGISVTGATTGDLTIQKNNVQGIINTNTGTFGAYGIDISGGNNVVVKNNFVSNVNFNMTGGAAFSTTFGIFGIRVGSGTGHKIYHNSVNLYGLVPGTATASLLSAAFGLVNTTSTGCDVRNNIFANNITGGTTSIAHVSAYLPSSGTSAMNLTWNNNLYYFGTDAARQGVGQAGTTAGTNFYTTLALLAAYSSTLSPAGTNDNASQAFTTAGPFVSNNDLHVTSSNDLGTPLGSVTDDIDNEMRSGTIPDIGADEFYCMGVVMNVADAGAGSLRDRIACVSTGSTITFDPSIWNSTILLTTGSILINKSITIAGPTVANVINISGSMSTVFNIVSGNLQFTGNVNVKQ
ncbi:MAG: hypothetical protein IPP15_20250 [Saprospiraceae bacterium]|uniref:Right handed beta helix domain-containing protein n=1 Tax=Candidatus Opimibacter skivensis TaxID=2982028 RepID=A0A9D7SWT3_9BACT|nr:hypothetical protein [Candidatus Opimibacter skivensis]